MGPPDSLFETTWWEIGDEAGLLELLRISPFFQAHDDLVLDASSWLDEIVHETPGEVPPDASYLGYHGVGNGIAFSFVGSWYPLNTLHELLGPGYQTGNAGYFSDVRATLEAGEQALPWAREWIWEVRDAQITVTRMQVNGPALELDTVTFAPPPDEAGPARASIIQVLNVRNVGAEAIDDVRVAVDLFSRASAVGADYLEQVRDGDRMRVRPLGEGWTSAGATTDTPEPGLRSPGFSLAAGTERQLTLVMSFAKEGEAIESVHEDVAARGYEALLSDTAAWWRAWHAAGLTVHTPDRKVDDLIMGLKGMARVQLAATGAAVQVSHYTGAWHRDIFPPVRAFLKMGYLDEAQSMARYLHGAAALEGGIGNALPADLIIPDAIDEPDWRAAVPFTDVRLLGEGPSFLPLMHTEAWRYTGDHGPLTARWDYLMHALEGQQVTAEGLLPFSGDETFRPIYGYNIGLGLSYAFEELTWSLYSGLLFVVACEDLARAAEAADLGTPEDRAWLLERAAFVRQATEDQYWLPEAGRYAAFLYRDPLTAEPRPSEDVNPQPLWLSYQPPDEPRALQNMTSTMDELLVDEGILQTRLDTDEALFGYAIGRGARTGMAPGYFLFSAAELNLPEAEGAFDALARFVSPSGNYPEAGLYTEPGRALAPQYDPVSFFGELWSRYRLWDGVVNLEALQHYLIGYRADVIDGWIALAPHLPHGAPWIEASRLLFKGHALSMRLAREGAGLSLSLNGEADPASYGLHEVRLWLTLDADAPTLVTLDDQALDATAYTWRPLPGGGSELSLTLPARASQRVTVE